MLGAFGHVDLGAACCGHPIVSIRFKLTLLVMAVLAPTLIASLLAIGYVYQDQRVRVAQSMRETTRALALAVDRDIAQRNAIIRTLSSVPSLSLADLERFYTTARDVADSWENSIILVDTQGQQLLNTRMPFGAELPHTPFLATPLDDPAAEFDVTNLYMAPIGKQYSFSVRRPIYIDGTLRYFLSMGSFANQINEVLVDQNLPKGWLGTVVDGSGRIVARNISPEAFIGKHVTGPIAEALGGSEEGFRETVSLDGIPLLSFYARSPESGWSVIIGLPISEVRQSAVQAMTVVGVFALLLIGVATLLAFWVGRRITRPLRMLDATAQAMGRGEAVHPASTGMSEIDRTAAVLAQASERIQNASAEMSARVAAAVEQVERSQKAMQQTQKLEALGRLTGGIAHDFNNLLQTLTIGLQLADMASSDPRAKKAIEACNKSVVRGTKLTRQLMAFGRHKVEETRHVDLRQLIVEMGDLLDGALPGRIGLTLELPERPWPVFIDPLQCELAVLNLVFNARDAMPRGGKVTLSLAQRALAEGEIEGLAAGAYAELCIVDSGEGMSEEVMSKAFEPFFTTKNVGEGTGLGLAQVYGFASQAHGTVLLQSAPGEGTRVRVLLPMSQEEGSVPLEAGAGPRPDVHSARVLLVDDDPLVRDVVAPALRELGFRVEVVGNADEALQRYRERRGGAGKPRFDIVFSDIVMPGTLDGIGLAQALREQEPNLPIVLATGYTERAPSDYGFTVLSKPYDVQTLVEALRAELARTAR